MEANGKNPYDLAWAVYQEMRDKYPDKFLKPHDHVWWLRKSVEAALLNVDPEQELETKVFMNYVNKDQSKE